MSRYSKLLVSTHNQGKLREIKQVLADTPLSVHGYRDFISYNIDVIEDGLTFEANAIKKAMAIPYLEESLILADDSGLEVDSLEGRPGIYSARYAGEGASSEQLCRKILLELEGVEARGAQFTCVMALRFSDGRCETVKGIVRGSIALQMTGQDGFGYDPIFVPEGFSVSFAEMSASEKNELSHRRRALDQILALLL